MLALSSGYIERGRHKFPKEATVAPWRLHQNFALDVLALRYASVEDGVMEFGRAAALPKRAGLSPEGDPSGLHV